MIASLAAIGLGPGLGGTTRSTQRPPDEPPPEAVETPVGIPSFSAPEPTIDPNQRYKAVIETNKGDIEIELFSDAPEAINSFAFLAGRGFYNGLIFYYVDKSFVAQAGDPTCDAEGRNTCIGTGGPGYTLPVEATEERHEQWAVVAPAVTDGQEVHGSQFRILFAPDERLDGRETVFGRVVKGQEVLEELPDFFVPCSVREVEGCASPEEYASSTLVIERVTVQPL